VKSVIRKVVKPYLDEFKEEQFQNYANSNGYMICPLGNVFVDAKA